MRGLAKERYRAKRAAGVCAYGGICFEPVQYPGASMCVKHATKVSEYANRYYHKKKRSEQPLVGDAVGDRVGVGVGAGHAKPVANVS